jgi:hypothetical protein
MDTLLEITLRSTLVEKVSMALYDVLFDFEDFDTYSQEGKVGRSSAVLYMLTLTLTVHRTASPPPRWVNMTTQLWRQCTLSFK